MAKVKRINKIITEDFPSKYSDLVGKLAFALNPFLDNIVFSLNNKLTFTDNLDAEVRQLEITPDLDLPVKLSTSLNFCNGVIITRVTNLTDSTATLSASPFIEFDNLDEDGSRLINIKNITGLTSSSKYRIRLILLNE
jgi:hypothetical protein